MCCLWRGTLDSFVEHLSLLFSEDLPKVPVHVEKGLDLAYQFVYCRSASQQADQYPELTVYCSRGKDMSSSRSALFSIEVRQPVRSSTSGSCNTVWRFISFNMSPFVHLRERLTEVLVTIDGCSVPGVPKSLIGCQEICYCVKTSPVSLFHSWSCCLLSSTVLVPFSVCGPECGSVGSIQKFCQNEWEIGH